MRRVTSSLAGFYKAALKDLEEEKDRIEAEIRQVRALYSRHSGGATAVRPVVAAETHVAYAKPRKVRNLSAAARARIAAAQKKRWAEFRKTPKE